MSSGSRSFATMIIFANQFDPFRHWGTVGFGIALQSRAWENNDVVPCTVLVNTIKNERGNSVMFAILKNSNQALMIAVVLSLVFLASGALTPAQARTLSYATSSPPTEDRPANQVLRWWADEVKRQTDGEIDIQIHWMQSLLKLKDAAQGVSAGVADIAPLIPEYTQAKMPLWTLSATGLGSGDHYVAGEAWQRVRDQNDALRVEEERNNMKYIAHYTGGASVLMSATRPYLTPDDFAGDKVRLTARAVRAAQLEDWPVTPVNLTFGELYSGLQRGTVDGSQSYLTYLIPYKHYEVVKHVVEPELGQTMVAVMMNRNTWQSLTPEQQQVFNELTPEFNRRLARANLEDASEAREKLQDHPEYPIKFHDLTPEQSKTWADAYRATEEENVEQAARRNPAAEEVAGRFMEELEKLEKEVEEDGYPWDQG